MDSINDLIHIPQIQRNCRFWMIRTNDGLFFNEFISSKFIAIGWNSIKKNTFPLSNSQREILQDHIKTTYKTNSPGLAINKCERFYSELKKGDIAVITGKEQIAFASIGDYYEENVEKFTEQLEIDVNDKIKERCYHEITECPYCKRRKIDIITIIDNRDDINPYLYKAILLNKHSLSSLNQYSDTILSSCYDIYIWKGTLSFSFKVQAQTNINAVVLSNFICSFATLLKSINEKNISVKTALHSPGDIVLQIGNWLSDPTNYLWIFVALMTLFGGKVGSVEFPSIWNVIKYFVERHDKQAAKQFGEEKLRLENEKLKEEIESLKLSNDKQRKLNDAAQSLSQSSEALKIRPISNQIIDIDMIRTEMENDNR